MNEANNRLKELIAKFVLKSNYWGFLFSRIRRKSFENLQSIMGVAAEQDGTISLIFNPDLLNQTDDDNIYKVLEHEGMHLLNKHIPRLLRILSNEIDEERKKFKMKIWNIASDCCVNDQADLPKFLTIAGKPYHLHFPELYDLPKNKAAEFYFERLLKQSQEQNLESKGSQGNIDDHSKWSENVKSISDLSSLSRKIDNYVGNIVKESVKNFNRERGNLPGYLEDLINDLLGPPKAPYYQIIRKLVKGSRLSKFNRSLTRINRKRTYVFEDDNSVPIISPFPGKKRDYSFDITLLLDTSGSMTKKDIIEGLSGIKNIIENDKYCKATVLENDTFLRKEYEVKRIRDIEFNILGRGGTTLRPGLERARELKSDVTLVFTDGETEDINSISRKLLPKKIIWVIQKDGTTKNINKTGGFIVRI